MDGDVRPGQAEIPGLQAPPAAAVLSAGDQLTAQREPTGQQVQAPAAQQAGRGPAAAGADAAAGLGTAVIPGAQLPVENAAAGLSAQPAPAYHRNAVPAEASAVPAVSSQQAFISQVAPGAIAAQRRYGIPAAVTIAQAIDESGWGQSGLATKDHNLFGIKGSGPAGSDVYSTSEYQDGQWVTVDAGFRVYHNIAESIADHSELLANGAAYQRAMADRDVPDAFANDLTGVYATDPNYGANLIALMKLYNLYQYDSPAQSPARSRPPRSRSPAFAPQPVAPQPVAQAPAARGVAQQVAPIGVAEPAMPGVVAVQTGLGAAHGGTAQATPAVRGGAAGGGARAQRGGTASAGRRSAARPRGRRRRAAGRRVAGRQEAGPLCAAGATSRATRTRWRRRLRFRLSRSGRLGAVASAGRRRVRRVRPGLPRGGTCRRYPPRYPPRS